MSCIKVMDEILANKIAAGEVVERCASVVKELVENSIDAKAKEIKIELKESGVSEIKVTDDGIGMEKDDAVLCFSRHATSKIIEEEDLYHINTLGFRGEALASIASVSEVTLKTCANDEGTLVTIQGGKIKDVSMTDAKKGTSIKVAKLFYNTPARLKHMKSLYTELASITDYVNKIALSHTDIKFILVNNNNTLLNTDGKGNLLKTISSVFGINVAKKMLPINASNEDYQISGYVSLPEIHRSSRNGIITLVNGRVVRNIDLNRAIHDAYHSYQPDNRYPITVIDIKVDPSLVDVNIHPTKMDIKFSKIDNLLTLIQSEIRKKLKGETLIPDIEVEEDIINEEILNKSFFNDNLKKVEENKPKEYKQTKEQIALNLERVVKEDSPLYKSSSIEKINKKEVEVKNHLPELYPVGLVLGTYIVCQNENGMTLIDQHAAKERINYEIYLEKLGNPKKDNIPLLIPFNIELTNSDYIIIKENMDILNDMGFIIEPWGVSSILVKAHPTFLPKGYEKEATNKIIEAVLTKEKDFDLKRFRNNLAATLSCKMSIKANTSLTILEMENLINDLRKCENPYNCPHGRPTMITYKKIELEKLFKRSGF